MRTLGGILRTGAIPDLTQMGWPTVRAGLPSMGFAAAMREMRATVARHSPGNAMPAIAVIGAGDGESRTIAALNVALAAARDGARVLMIDADPAARGLSNRVSSPGAGEPGLLGWLSIGGKASRAITTVNGVSILPAFRGAGPGDAIRRAIAQARSAGGHDLVVLDGPTMPWTTPTAS